MDTFFIRFCLQRMEGALKEDFPYECIMEASKEEVSSFLAECNAWQQEQADEIGFVMNLAELNGKKVLFVGDSLTADRFGYRGIVTKAAKLTSYNTAISGAISTDMFRYLQDHIQMYNPEIISILIGTNDSLIIAGEKNLVSKEEYGVNLEKIIAISKRSGAKVIISTLPPTDEEKFKSPNKSNNNHNIGMYCDIIRNKAQEYGVMLNDFAESVKGLPLKEILEDDGVHLTKFGQAYLAKAWLDTIVNNTY